MVRIKASYVVCGWCVFIAEDATLLVSGNLQVAELAVQRRWANRNRRNDLEVARFSTFAMVIVWRQPHHVDDSGLTPALAITTPSIDSIRTLRTCHSP